MDSLLYYSLDEILSKFRFRRKIKLFGSLQKSGTRDVQWGTSRLRDVRDVSDVHHA